MIGSGFQNIFRIPELKKRILFSLALLIVYRIGVHIPVPGIDALALASFFARAKGTLLGLFDMFSGGAFERLSVFALGIMPYISSSIILQLLTVVVPHLERLSKEGEQGRKKITQYTRYGTIVLSIIQGFGSQHRTGKHECSGRCTGCTAAWVGLSDSDCYNTDRWNCLYHVAGRTDHRKRDWKWNFSDHILRHCCPNAQCD